MTYIDLPGDMLRQSADLGPNFIDPSFKVIHRPIKTCPPISEVKAALDLLSKAERPLIVIGKGAAYSTGASELIRDFIYQTNIPFLATPMGKGCVPDNDSNSVAPAR